MQFKQICIFCGHNKNRLSNEHVFAEWLHEYIPRTATSYSYKVLKHDWDEDTKSFKTTKIRDIDRNGDPHTQKLRVVCHFCNNGWMSRLQNTAKPVLVPFIKEHKEQILPDDILVIVRWVTMFSMVIEYRHRNSVIFTEEQRAAFKASTAIPENLVIAVGRYVGKKMYGTLPYSVGSTKLFASINAHSKPIDDYQISLFSLGELLFIVVAGPPEHLQNREFINTSCLEQVGFNFIHGHHLTEKPALITKIDDVVLSDVVATLLPNPETVRYYTPEPQLEITAYPKGMPAHYYPRDVTIYFSDNSAFGYSESLKVHVPKALY